MPINKHDRIAFVLYGIGLILLAVNIALSPFFETTILQIVLYFGVVGILLHAGSRIAQFDNFAARHIGNMFKMVGHSAWADAFLIHALLGFTVTISNPGTGILGWKPMVWVPGLIQSEPHYYFYLITGIGAVVTYSLHAIRMSTVTDKFRNMIQEKFTGRGGYVDLVIGYDSFVGGAVKSIYYPLLVSERTVTTWTSVWSNLPVVGPFFAGSISTGADAIAVTVVFWLAHAYAYWYVLRIAVED